MDYRQVIPALESTREVGYKLRVALPQERQRPVREDNTPAIGGIGAILFDDRDVVAQVHLLVEQREIQTGRTAANAEDPQVALLCTADSHLNSRLNVQSVCLLRPCRGAARQRGA